jgi:alpha-tubulin suppressor-like RCC1 family protein
MDPVPRPLQVGQSFASVSAGREHACALDAEGRAYCWGSNAFGQLGIGAEDTLAHPEPAAVAGGLRFRTLSSGGAVTCGIATDDRAYCWGRNDRGQLGDGTTADRAMPAQVFGGLAFTSISVSLGDTSLVPVGHPAVGHSCGITKTEEAYCWGTGSAGQLGNGRTGDSPLPVEVAVVL